MHDETTLIRVASGSRSPAVAGAIAGMVRDGKEPTVQAIGAAAVNQAVKASAIARTYLEEDGIDVVWTSSFTDVVIEGNERTAIRLQILRR
jgi:stage V sporulation protein S